MDPIILGISIALVVAAGFFALTKLGQISPAEARRLLQGGAKIVDVRTHEEFASGHIEKAVNVPLSEIPRLFAQVAPDKSQPLLLHCKMGGRSAIARKLLHQQGYTQVHNLGSLDRAKRIVES